MSSRSAASRAASARWRRSLQVREPLPARLHLGPRRGHGGEERRPLLLQESTSLLLLVPLQPRGLQLLKLRGDGRDEGLGVAERLRAEAGFAQSLLDRPDVARGLLALAFELRELPLQALELAARPLARDLPSPERFRGLALGLLGLPQGRVRVPERRSRATRHGLHRLRADGTSLPRLQVTPELVGGVLPVELFACGAGVLAGQSRRFRSLLERGHRGFGSGEGSTLRLESRLLPGTRPAQALAPTGKGDELQAGRPRPQEQRVAVGVEGERGERRLVGFAPSLQLLATLVRFSERSLGRFRPLFLRGAVGLGRLPLPPGLSDAARDLERVPDRVLLAAELVALLLRPQKLDPKSLEVPWRRVGVLRGELLREELGLVAGFRGLAVGQRVHLLVDLEVQEGDQDLPALVRTALEERVELALGQDHGARERVVVEADDLPDLLFHLARPVGKGLPALAVPALEARLGRAPARPRGTDDAVRPLPHLELQVHGQPLGPVADELAVLLRHARHLAVEREDERRR